MHIDFHDHNIMYIHLHSKIKRRTNDKSVKQLGKENKKQNIFSLFYRKIPQKKKITRSFKRLVTVKKRMALAIQFQSSTTNYNHFFKVV